MCIARKVENQSKHMNTNNHHVSSQQQAVPLQLYFVRATSSCCTWPFNKDREMDHENDAVSMLHINRARVGSRFKHASYPPSQIIVQAYSSLEQKGEVSDVCISMAACLFANPIVILARKADHAPGTKLMIAWHCCSMLGNFCYLLFSPFKNLQCLNIRRTPTFRENIIKGIISYSPGVSKNYSRRGGGCWEY